MHLTTPAPTASIRYDGTVLRADQELPALLGVHPDDFVGSSLCTFGHQPVDSVAITDCLRAAVDATADHVRVALRTADDRELHVALVATRVGGTITVVVIDETNRVRAEQELASSQRRWLAMARNAADIVFTTADDGKLTSVTSTLPQRLGWAVEDVIGRRGLSFVHPDDRHLGDAAWIAVAGRQSHEVQLDLRLVHADQTVSWARLVITDLRDDPDVRSIVGNVTDITEQKTAEAHRRHEEDRFRARFDQSKLPQTMQAMDGTFEAVNDAFCALVGRSRNEVIGLRPADIVHADDAFPGEATGPMMVARGVDWAQIDRVLQDRDGRPIPVRIDATLLRGPDGAPSGSTGAFHDLSALRDSERARVELQQFFNVVAERSHEFVTLHDGDGRPLYASPAGRAMFGPGFTGSLEELASSMHPEDMDDAAAAWEHMLDLGESHTWRYRIRDAADDEWVWIEQTSTNLLDTEVGGVISSHRDVTAEVSTEQALRTSEARYRAMAETAEEGIVVISPDGRVSYANARLSTMLGLDAENLVGVHVWSVLDGETRDAVARRIGGRRVRGSERYEVPYPHPDGTRRTLWIAASPMPDVDGEPQGSLAMISDITDSRRVQEELRHAAQHDHLTGLPNRTMLMNHLENLDLPTDPGTAVLFVDLDHFKDVNDGRGHTAGDDVLIEVADRLLATVGLSGLVARFGGDEFVVVLHHVDKQAATDMGAAVLEALTESFSIGHHAIRVGATIGIALSPAASADDLLRFADTAMYAAKAGGRGRLRLFDSTLAKQAEERYVLGAELLTALANDELEMKYQPVVDVSTGEVVGVEALARWHHPTIGDVSPSRFVALAELNASSSELDRWVIKRTMRDIGELKADLTMPEDAYVSVNLSGQSLSDEGLGAYIEGCVAAADLDPSVVMLEITESTIMADKDEAVTMLRRLRKRGFDIAIDDFGTGYSSMAYLRDLPLSVLKIDRGFVRGIPEDTHSLAIVRSLIELARSLDLQVVAEGVETQAHLDVLREHGCGLAQGWWWSSALSVHELRSSKILTDRFDGLDVRPLAR